MSLINDALRRAKQAQQETSPPPPAPGLRPIEQVAQTGTGRSGMLLPLVLGALALLTLLLLWELSRRPSPTNSAEGTSQLSVAARPLTPVDAGTSTAAGHSVRTAPVSPGTTSGSTETAVQAPVVATDPSASTPPTANVAASATNQISPASEAADTNRASNVEAAPPPLKLQSIVFNPKRPSAMINGKIMFVGDKIRDFHVMAIRANEVTLAGLGRTNVLSLEP